jgi:hypothetical protein
MVSAISFQTRGILDAEHVLRDSVPAALYCWTQMYGSFQSQFSRHRPLAV